MPQVKGIAKNKPVFGKQSTSNGHPMLDASRLSLWLLWGVAVANAVTMFYIQEQWTSYPSEILFPPQPFFTKWSEVCHNIKLVFQGYHDGYLRTIWGYVVFAAMAAFFLALGKFLWKTMLGQVCDEFNNFLYSLERWSYYYLLGSLTGSFIWLALGICGLLNAASAFILGALGLGMIIIETVRNRLFQHHYGKLNAWRIEAKSSEKFLALILLTLLVSYSFTSVQSQVYSDTLLTHLSLPNFYIQYGKVFAYPHNIYSYFPQNTEMLVMWPLLLNSEVGAALFMAGFLAALIFIALGFLKRLISGTLSYLIVLAVVSAPAVAWFSTTVKNDFPSAVFLFAHYLLLIEGMNRVAVKPELANKLLLISGLFAGGAMGHKLTALVPSFISALLILVYCLRNRHWILLGRFLAGWMAAMVPWHIKSLAATGDPLYPYLSALFKFKMASAWHSTSMVSTSFQNQGWQGVWDYFSLLIGTHHDIQGLIQPPNWGPTIFFALLVPLIWKIQAGDGYRIGVLSSSLGWIIHLFYGLEIRYHLACVAASVCVPVAVAAGQQAKTKSFNRFSYILPAIFGISFIQNIMTSHMIDKIRSSLGQILSGYGPGNFSLRATDQQADNMRWVGHLIHAKTAREDAVLLSGIHYSYGIKRKMFFSNDRDKDVLQALAEQSADAIELADKIKKMGVRHLLINPSVLNGYLQSPNPDLRLSPLEMNKINDFIKGFMTIKFATHDAKIFWFVFKSDKGQENIDLTDSDIDANPSVVMETVQKLAEGRNFDSAFKITGQALKRPMHHRIRGSFYSILGDLSWKQGNIAKAEEYFKDSIIAAPDCAEFQINLANFYAERGIHTDSIKGLLLRVQELGGKNLIHSFASLEPYLKSN